MKNGRRKRKRAAWVNVATADTGVETGRKGAIPVAIKYQHVTNSNFWRLITSIAKLAILFHCDSDRVL